MSYSEGVSFLSGVEGWTGIGFLGKGFDALGLGVVLAGEDSNRLKILSRFLL